MDQDNEIELSDIGRALVEASETERNSARDVLRELFPYIDEASRRMSSRAISRWLKDNFSVQISPASVLRALRDPDKHYQDFVEYIEPWALIVENATNCSMEHFLFDYRLFNHVIEEEVSMQAVEAEEVLEEFNELRAAAVTLREKWFGLSSRARANCRRFIGSANEEKEETMGDEPK